MKNRIKSKYDIFKQKTYIIIYGINTFWGKTFDIALLVVILFSSSLIIMESVKGVDTKYHHFLVISEWVITILFTLEYLLRIICNKHSWKYIFSFYGIIDLIAILPVYLSFFAVWSKFLSIVRILRLLRVFRVLEVMKFTRQANELKDAIYMSRTKIMVFIYFMTVICILLGAFMYMVEPHDKAFTSIPRSIYWCIVTLTTVGYGDVVPTSVFGQVMASIIMVLGYGVIAVPTGIITSEYTKLRKNKTQHLHLQNSIHNAQSCSFCGNSVHHSSAHFCHQCGHKINL